MVATYANPEVLEFYRTLPFNVRETVAESVAAVRQTDHVREAYPVLRPLMREGLRVLDVGCGTGWFANSLAQHHGAKVTGLDFNAVAVGRAREVAAAMKLPTEFAVGDLFTWEPEAQFDLVVSLGVLHHTDNCAAALRRVCERFVRPGGHAFIGLYHAWGRAPLLAHFKSMQARGASEAELAERYRELHSGITDETLLLSWFRDQVLHPHETQHTLEEMLPLLREAGMTLVSTSINRFGPYASTQALVEEEKGYRALAEQRLRENRYFTGFFVFLARRALPGEIDAKPYVEYDPVIGYRYAAGIDQTLPRPGGGSYRIRVNAQGLRADREYSPRKPAGTRRLIVCGDSMPAGQYISNSQRFSELLERRVPGLEVINLALEGSGTDQQLLLYERAGLQYEHDAVVVMPFLQNIRRNLADAREAIDPRTGQRVLRGKPRYEIVAGELALRNVPVPNDPASAPAAVDVVPGWREQAKARLSALPGADLAKRLLYAAVPWEPFPEYRDPDGAAWRLMEAILRRFKSLAGDRPLVIAPTFYASYVRYRMARNYWARYASLESIPRVHAVDLLPRFRALGSEAVRCFQEPHDMHFSAYGHLMLATVLEAELRRLGILPAAGAE